MNLKKEDVPVIKSYRYRNRELFVVSEERKRLKIDGKKGLSSYE